VPYFIPFNNERVDTIYIARPSFVNFTIHKTGTYLPGDSIALRVVDYTSPTNFSFDFRNLTKDKAIAPDRTFNLYTWYHTPFYDKLYFQWDIIRNGSVLSTKLDSTDLIQFGTQNFTLNY
jgi:hypothetical protein